MSYKSSHLFLRLKIRVKISRGIRGRDHWCSAVKLEFEIPLRHCAQLAPNGPQFSLLFPTINQNTKAVASRPHIASWAVWGLVSPLRLSAEAGQISGKLSWISCQGPAAASGRHPRAAGLKQQCPHRPGSGA